MEEVDAEMLSQESTHCYDSLLCELLGMYFMDNMKRNRIIIYRIVNEPWRLWSGHTTTLVLLV